MFWRGWWRFAGFRRFRGRRLSRRAEYFRGSEEYRPSRVAMDVRHSETANRLALEVEFDQHDRLAADNPPVVAGLDRQDLRGLVVHDTPVGVFDVNLAPGKEAHVYVHAPIRPHSRLHVDRPGESGGVDHAIDAGRARASSVNPDTGHFAAIGVVDDGNERIQVRRTAQNGRASFRAAEFFTVFRAAFDVFTVFRLGFFFAMWPSSRSAGSG